MNIKLPITIATTLLLLSCSVVISHEVNGPREPSVSSTRYSLPPLPHLDEELSDSEIHMLLLEHIEMLRNDLKRMADK